MSGDRVSEPLLIDKKIGPLTVLFGEGMGKYPHGNALVIEGRDKSAIIDPNLGVVARKDCLPQVDLVLHSHAHEDHVAGSHLFPNVPWYVHNDDLLGLQSLDGIMEIYGFPEPERSRFAEVIRNEFHYMAKEDAIAFKEGDVFDFGGVSLEVIHTPGHTRGHCCFLISWENSNEKLVYLGDIELTGFGPYYGDAWSSLEDFEASIGKLKKIDAHWWLTFHHKGLIEGKSTFVEMLDKFSSVIDSRESRLLKYLSEPRSIEDIVAHRFVYRPGVEGDTFDLIERRSMTQHLNRLMGAGRIAQEEGRYVLV